LRDSNQQFAKQQFDLMRVVAKTSDILRYRLDLQNLHAALDSTVTVHTLVA